jgi:hypothetical protein
MKMVLSLSLASGAAGFAALFGLSAMTVTPDKSAKLTQLCLMLVALATALAWLMVAVWTYRRMQSDKPDLPAFMERGLAVIAVIYIFGCGAAFFG